MSYVLEVLQGPEAGRQIHLASGEVVIGRDRQYASVVLTDPKISRAHVRFFYRDGAWYVLDLDGSGTYFNRTRLDSGPALINPGDIIQLGDSMLRVALVPGPALAPVGSSAPTVPLQQGVPPASWGTPPGEPPPQQQHNVQVSVTSNNNAGLVAIAIAILFLGLGPCGLLCLGVAVLAALPWLMLAGGVGLSIYGYALAAAATGLPGDSRLQRGRVLFWLGVVLGVAGLIMIIWWMTSVSDQQGAADNTSAQGIRATPELAHEGAPPTYEVVKTEDVSFGRLSVRVRVPEHYPQRQVELVAQSIVAEMSERRAVNAISILFHGPDTYTDGPADIAIVEWAPDGDWSKAGSVPAGDYTSFKYAVRYFDAVEVPSHPGNRLVASSGTGLLGVPLPEGATLTERTDGGPGRDPTETYSISAPSGAILNFFLEVMPREGWSKYGPSGPTWVIFRQGNHKIGIFIAEGGGSFELMGS